MVAISSLLVATVVGCGVYLVLSRHLQRVVLGLLLLSNGVNLLVITATGLEPGHGPPILADEGGDAPVVDPLPHAFVLTAIVIGLAVTSFVMAMAVATFRERRSDVLEDDPP